MTKKKNVTEKELLEMTFNPPDLDLEEAFSPEAKKRAKAFQEAMEKEDAEEAKKK